MSEFDKSNEGYCGTCSRRLFFGPQTKIPKQSYCAVCGKEVTILTRAEVFARDVQRLETHWPSENNAFRKKIWAHMETRGSYVDVSVTDFIETLVKNVEHFKFYATSYDEFPFQERLDGAKGEGADIVALVLIVIDKLERK